MVARVVVLALSRKAFEERRDAVGSGKREEKCERLWSLNSKEIFFLQNPRPPKSYCYLISLLQHM